SAPFIVITRQPDFSKVFELFNLAYLFGRKVTVVIDDGHLFTVLVEEYLGLFCIEQEVVVDKAHSHNSSIMPESQQICVSLYWQENINVQRMSTARPDKSR